MKPRQCWAGDSAWRVTSYWGNNWGANWVIQLQTCLSAPVPAPWGGFLRFMLVRLLSTKTEQANAAWSFQHDNGGAIQAVSKAKHRACGSFGTYHANQRP